MRNDERRRKPSRTADTQAAMRQQSVIAKSLIEKEEREREHTVTRRGEQDVRRGERNERFKIAPKKNSVDASQRHRKPLEERR